MELNSSVRDRSYTETPRYKRTYGSSGDGAEERQEEKRKRTARAGRA